MKESETLADKIAGLLTTTPGNLDLENEIDETSAKVVDFNENQEDHERLLSSFRKQNIDLLADVDERYAGKTISRKKLVDVDELEDEDDNYEGDYFEDDDDSSKKSENSDSDISEDNDDQNNENGNQESENEEDEDENSGESYDDNTQEENFVHVKDADISSQVKKGLCVRNQMSIWENLLETRIQIQKCLLTSNKLPQSEAYQEMKTNKEFSKKVSETKKSVANLLDKLLLLQNLVIKKFPETNNILNIDKLKDSEGINADDDEEINSDTDAEVDEDTGSEEEIPKKRRKLITEYNKEINDRHNIYKTYRNDTIQKWHEKTRIAILKQSSNSHSLINHIEHTLSDKTKLVRRTQLKRSDYRILGEKEKGTDEATKFTEECNTNIYDDDDFYHQLLRELIEVKSADLTDPVQLGQQWIQLQNLRSKMKRKVDTKATKGRKIRYAVHSKLVNFMAPIDENNWTDEAKTELYSSLFGKKQIVK